MKKLFNDNYKFIIHLSMSRAGSGFVCSLLDGHSSIFIPHFDNSNQDFLNILLKNKKLDFNKKKELALEHFSAEKSKGRYIYFGMHNPDKKQVEFLEKLGKCKIIISTRDTISSFCNRLENERKDARFIAASFFHGLTINTIVFSNFNYKKYKVFQISLPELHLNPRDTMVSLCKFLRIEYSKTLLNSTKNGYLWKPNVKKGEIGDGDFNFMRFKKRNKSNLLSENTLFYIELISKNYEKSFEDLNKYSRSYNLKTNKNKFLKLLSLLKFNCFDKEIFLQIPKKFIVLNILSYLSFRYYLLLSFLKLNKRIFFYLSPYIIFFIIISKLNLNKKNKF